MDRRSPEEIRIEILRNRQKWDQEAAEWFALFMERFGGEEGVRKHLRRLLDEIDRPNPDDPDQELLAEQSIEGFCIGFKNVFPDEWVDQAVEAWREYR